MQVLGLLSRGCCNKTIARDLDVAVGTVKTHVRAIMYKLGSRSRTAVVLEANRRGLITIG
jgi:DNA-binding NarL/FixJ family response regulator